MRVAPSLCMSAALATCLAIAGCATSAEHADRTNQTLSNSASPPLPAPTFPTDWIGRWLGDARVTRAAGPAIEFKMGLNIEPTATPGTYTWTIIYSGEAGTQIRPYTIARMADKPGTFVIDEQNSILIDAIYLDGGLYSAFEIQGTTINVVYRLQRRGPNGDEIVVELVSTDENTTRQSGGKDAVPRVNSLAPLSLQRAILRRVSTPAR